MSHLRHEQPSDVLELAMAGLPLFDELVRMPALDMTTNAATAQPTAVPAKPTASARNAPAARKRKRASLSPARNHQLAQPMTLSDEASVLVANADQRATKVLTEPTTAMSSAQVQSLAEAERLCEQAVERWFERRAQVSCGEASVRAQVADVFDEALERAVAVRFALRVVRERCKSVVFPTSVGAVAGLTAFAIAYTLKY